VVNLPPDRLALKAVECIDLAVLELQQIFDYQPHKKNSGLRVSSSSLLPERVDDGEPHASLLHQFGNRSTFFEFSEQQICAPFVVSLEGLAAHRTMVFHPQRSQALIRVKHHLPSKSYYKPSQSLSKQRTLPNLLKSRDTAAQSNVTPVL